MATIKAYTDLQQSKKLAKILSTESADMIWVLANQDLPMIKAIAYKDSEKSKYYEILPAWSLAALLNIMPYPSLHKTFSGWRCDSYNKEGTSCKLGELSGNPVDACVTMIERLHELNLL